MPVKNAEKHLNDCLHSIQAQTYPNWELIAIDDHSDDRSFDLLNKAASKDNRIRVERNDGVGIIDALRLAIDLTSGIYISRMDADDRMPKKKLATLLLHCREKKVVTGEVEYFGTSEITEGYQRYQNWLNGLGDGYEFIYRECIVASPNWMIEKSFFDSFDWERWRYPEDYDLVFHWQKAGYDLQRIPVLTHLWREHPDRTSRNSDVYQQKSFFELKTKWFIENHGHGPFQLIGSGKKAKLVRSVFAEEEVDYGRFDLYEGENINTLDHLDPNVTTILTNWPLEVNVQVEIQDYLKSIGFSFGKNLWLF